MKVLVVGAGVIGLTTALELSGQGYSVEIWAENVSPKTTSDVAAAFWYPYEAYPIQLVSKWARYSFEKFKDLGDAGVKPSLLVELYRKNVVRPPWYEMTDGYTELAADNQALPDGFRAGFSFETFVIDTSIYMPYLVQKCREAALDVDKRTLDSLDRLPDHFDAVVNCTGFGAAQLCQDKELTCARGQVLRIEKPPDTAERPVMLFHEDDSTRFAMIVPRVNDIVLGGTFELGCSDTEPNQEESLRIVDRCRELAPDLITSKSPNILGTVCGLRPIRSSVRLELEERESGPPVIHNYGHGGAGITLSWGCAHEVVQLLNR